MKFESVIIFLPWDVIEVALTGDTQRAAGLLASQYRWPFRLAVQRILEWKIQQAEIARLALTVANENEPATV